MALFVSSVWDGVNVCEFKSESCVTCMRKSGWSFISLRYCIDMIAINVLNHHYKFISISFTVLGCNMVRCLITNAKHYAHHIFVIYMYV